MRVICITNHDLLPDQKLAEMPYRSWRDAYIDEISRISACHPEAIVIREKLLSGIDYTNLYQTMMRRESAEGTLVIWHDHFEALRLYIRFHRREQWPKAIFFSGREAGGLSITDLRWLKQENIRYGLTCHSMIELDDAKKAEADFIMASHIFPTECKKNLKPKGIEFLGEVCRNTDIPVIALGGINAENASRCIDAGAAGVAVMSLSMNENKDELQQIIDI